MLNFTDDVSDLLKDLGIGDVPEAPDTEETSQEASSNDDDETIETQSEEQEESNEEEINTPPKTVNKDIKDSSILSSIAKTLLEEGYFTLDDDEKLEINSTEEFVDVLEKDRKSVV